LAQVGLGKNPPAHGDFTFYFHKNNAFLGIFRLKI